MIPPIQHKRQRIMHIQQDHNLVGGVVVRQRQIHKERKQDIKETFNEDGEVVQEGIDLVLVDIANGGKTANNTEEQETGQEGALQGGSILEVEVSVGVGVGVTFDFGLVVIGTKQALQARLRRGSVDLA